MPGIGQCWEGTLSAASAGKDVSNVVDEINDGTANIFVKNLLLASYDSSTHTMGAGSVVASSLKTIGADILGSSAKDTRFVFNNPYEEEGDTAEALYSSIYRNARTASLHAGADAASPNSIHVNLFSLTSKSLGLLSADVSTQEGALATINRMGDALHLVSGVRSYYGAVQNRLEHTVANLDNEAENTQAAESRIRDTDIAEAMVAYSATQILMQAGQSVLAQANQQTQGVLSLLGQ